MEALLDTLAQGEGALAYAVLLLSAAIEYIFPPFPGDTITLFGAFLITARGWNAPAVLVVVTLGSLLGATVDWAIGVRLGRKPDTPPSTWLGRYWRRAATRMGPLIDTLAERGASYIVVNRFLPGVRALFFVAAGMAGLRLRGVLFWGALSALAWNLLIIAVGAAVGASWDRLRALFEAYTTVGWIVVAALVAGIAWWLFRRRAAERDDAPAAREE